MQIHQLRSFVAVAELRHFTQAATVVGISQPSLSKQIHNLERELNAPLFERARGDITLTAAGEALLPIAQRIIADVEAARREVQELVGLRRGRVRLGATPSLCASVVPRVLRHYRDRYPGIELHIEEGGSQDLVRNLVRGELDLALVVVPEQGADPALHTEPLLREHLVVASVEPLAATTSAGELHLTDLHNHPLVMFRTGYDLRDATLEACRRAGFTPTFAVEGGEMDAVLGLVEAGLGVALVPSVVIAGRPRLHATPLVRPGVQRTIALAQRREIVPSHAAQAMRETIFAYLREAAGSGELPAGVELMVS